uniref:Uncharacterized protein n=1 Tax=Seriola dumerili TaxID=41447 RepID=A0A3B4T5F3_SERDU
MRVSFSHKVAIIHLLSMLLQPFRPWEPEAVKRCNTVILSMSHLSFGFSTMSNYSCLFLYGLRGLALSSRSELQQVLERRKRVQSDQEEVGQSRTPLEDVLLRRQQKQLEEQEEKLQEEAQLMEFVRVRQNLRKIHSVIQNKTAHF